MVLNSVIHHTLFKREHLECDAGTVCSASYLPQRAVAMHACAHWEVSL
jgi:hypothetical protein